MAKPTAKWTMLYADVQDGKFVHYLRLIPPNTDIESVGFPHGVSIGGAHFDNPEDAAPLMIAIDRLMDQVIRDEVAQS